MELKKIMAHPVKNNGTCIGVSASSVVQSSVGLVSSFLKYHSGIYNEDFTFFETSRVWVFEGAFVLIPFRSIYHARTCTPRQNHHNINMV